MLFSSSTCFHICKMLPSLLAAELEANLPQHRIICLLFCRAQSLYTYVYSVKSNRRSNVWIELLYVEGRSCTTQSFVSQNVFTETRYATYASTDATARQRFCLEPREASKDPSRQRQRHVFSDRRHWFDRSMTDPPICQANSNRES